VIEEAEVGVEAVNRGQELVSVTDMALAELRGGIALGL